MIWASRSIADLGRQQHSPATLVDLEHEQTTFGLDSPEDDAHGGGLRTFDPGSPAKPSAHHGELPIFDPANAMTPDPDAFDHADC